MLTTTAIFAEYKDLEARVDALRAAHVSILKYVTSRPPPSPLALTATHRVTKVYESETYDYPTQIQESLAEISSSIGYNLTSLAASGLNRTSLPSPAAPSAPPATQHKTLPHALTRAAHAAAGSVASGPGGDADRLARALELYAGGWEKVAGARLEQDGAIAQNFLHPWQTTLNASIAVALRARQAVRVSRLELDAAKQTYVLCSGCSFPIF